jgi:hypothetical protein
MGLPVWNRQAFCRVAMRSKHGCNQRFVLPCQATQKNGDATVFIRSERRVNGPMKMRCTFPSRSLIAEHIHS